MSFLRKKQISLMDLADKIIVDSGRDMHTVINNLGINQEILQSVEKSEVFPAWGEYLKIYCAVTEKVIDGKQGEKLAKVHKEAFINMVRARLEIADNNAVTPVLLECMNDPTWQEDMAIYNSLTIDKIPTIAQARFGGALPFDVTGKNAELLKCISEFIQKSYEKISKYSFNF